MPLLIVAAVTGVHSLMSGTAAADFGGRKATATASGIVDGFVYLGSGVQSVGVGYLVLWWFEERQTMPRGAGLSAARSRRDVGT